MTDKQPAALLIAATLEAFDMDGAADAVRRLHASHQHTNGNVALMADILNRRPAMNAGLVEAYAAWTAEVYNLMGAMAAAPANDADRAMRAAQPEGSQPAPQQEGRERDMPIGALLPCPCCGGKATEYDRFNANRVSCNSCGLSVRQSEQGAGDAAQHWNRRAPQPSPTAQGDALDAARYRYLRDGDWRENDKLESIIRLQLNSLWDAAIDAARTAQEGNSHD